MGHPTASVTYRQKARVDAATQVSPWQQAGGSGGAPEEHCCPALEQRLLGFAVPSPVRATVRGLPVALSVTVMDPVRLPEAAGANVTVITQLAPVARVEPQVLVCEKFVLATMLVI